MPELRFVQIHRGLGFKGWAAVVVGLAIVAGIAIAVAVVAVSLFLIFVPVTILATLAYYLLRRFSPRARPGAGPGMIEGEFRVLDAREIEYRSGEDRRRRDG